MNSKVCNYGYAFIRLVAVCLVLSGCLGISGCNSKSETEILLKEYEERTLDAINDYCKAPFFQAANRLAAYIEYLEQSRQRLSQDRNVDHMLCLSHGKLGYMLLHSEDDISAYRELNATYLYQTRLQQRAGLEPIPRSEFVDYIIDGMKKSDDGIRVAWKEHHRLNTNVVAKVKVRFDGGL